MTTKQCLIKIKKLMKDDRQYVLKESERLLNSGGIDKENYPKDFSLSQIILHVVYKNLSDQRRPLSISFKEDANNLKHF